MTYNPVITLVDSTGVAIGSAAGIPVIVTSNTETILITALGAADTTAAGSKTSADQTNTGARGVKVVLDMTVPGTGSVTLAIQGKDPASGKYYTILAGTPVTTVSTTVYTVYPGLAAAANVTANDVLPRTWRVQVTANNANPISYTVGASVVA